MPENNDLYSTLPDLALAEYFRNAGSVLADESAVLGIVIRDILATDGQLNNKAIILRLVHALESADSAAQADILRKTLEIVVGYTPDDA